MLQGLAFGAYIFNGLGVLGGRDDGYGLAVVDNVFQFVLPEHRIRGNGDGADLMDMIKSHIKDGKDDGLVIFSGTIPVVTGEIIYGSYFRGELIDTRLNRTLSCEYKIRKLDYLQEMEPV